METFKAVSPSAFTNEAPAEVGTVFIDLQLKLQCPDGIYDWVRYFDCLTGNLIRKYVNTPGIVNVICAYDQYTDSPLAKGPTQNRRKNRGPVGTFAQHQPLSAMMPPNHNTLLFNRAYKRKVVHLMIEFIQKTIKVANLEQRIIICWEGNPWVAVGRGAAKRAGEDGPDSPAVPGIEFEVTCGLGECDVRWTRYLAWGDMILEAIDGNPLNPKP